MTAGQPPAPLRVAAAQAESVSGDVSANVATALSLVDEAARAGARLVVLPELFLTGYDPDAWSETLLDVDDERLRPLADAARTGDVVVVAGAAVRRASGEPPTATLSLLAFDADGTVTAPYDKQHLFDAERSFFTPGDHGASIEVDGWELGLGICYDGCFPAHAMAAADDGALGYLCPSAYYVGSEHRRDLYYPARALDNGMYVVLSGLAGRCGRFALSGGTAIFDPEGRVVDRVEGGGAGLALADLDAAVVSAARETNPLLRHRVGNLGARRWQRVGAR